jgi:type VI secretion system protein ImpA
MASPPILDLDALLAPISTDRPAGDPLPYELRLRFEDDRKEENPDDFAPDDPMRPTKPKKANWQGIIEAAKDALTTQSKDLVVAARLTEGLARQHGFGGLRDGLRLLRLLVEQCWDRLHPLIEDGDLEARAGPFFWLDDADRGARFPNTLRFLPMIKAESGQYSWIDWKQSQDGTGGVSREDLQKAIDGCDPEGCKQLAEDLTESLNELNKLAIVLGEKMKTAAPGLTGLRQALESCHHLASHLAESRPVETDQPAGAGGTDGKTSAPAGRATVAATRSELYRQLAQAAARLRELEPHSPVPYLVQKAVELGSLPFPQLIRELIRDSSVLTELNREMGIKEEASS